MPEEVEIETRELQETIEELHEERKERAEEARKTSWVRYIALSTAVLAVFAAVGALLSGALVNEAMMDQLRASDTWAEYQASRLKNHLYTLETNRLLDSGAAPSLGHGDRKDPASHTSAESARGEAGAHRSTGGHPAAASKKETTLAAASPEARLKQYSGKVSDEAGKEEKLQDKARELEHESQERMHKHHSFAYAVALIQVAIALSAIAALTRIKAVWGLSLVAGLIGIGFFLGGLLGR